MYAKDVLFPDWHKVKEEAIKVMHMEDKSFRKWVLESSPEWRNKVLEEATRIKYGNIARS